MKHELFKDATGEQQQVSLPCNMTFDYAETPAGVLVSVFGFTAGPPATVNSPQILVPGYNPAACFNGPSLGGNYFAYMIAFLDTEHIPTIKLRGWVTSISTCQGKPNEVSLDIPLKARLL
jgi:hypothetical protein